MRNGKEREDKKRENTLILNMGSLIWCCSAESIMMF
jgi:hypothetical protein